MEITITKKSGNWTFGTIGGFNFEIKHFDEPSEFGIEDAETGIPGRISKLWISRTWGEHWTVASYDRGWDKLPLTDNEIEATNAVIDRFN